MDDDELYEFVGGGGDTCDTCAAMAGFYAEPPSVPVHENCGCQVVPPGENCDDEFRNVSTDTMTYEIEAPAGEFENCGAPATTLDFGAGDSFADTFGDSSEGDPDMDCEASGGGGGGTASAEIPANSRGSVSMTVEMTKTMCTGEKWRVCTHLDPVAGTHITETYIGQAVGFADSAGDVISVEVEAESCG